MAQITLPANIKNGDPLDADQVMSNDQTITQAMNGGLEATSNVKVASAVSQPGSANGVGVSVALAAADHQHMIQGFENRAADPTTGNFLGRVYWNTATGKFRYCTLVAGNIFTDLTPDALSLVLHAAQHKDGGHDPLADNTITDHMLAAKGSVQSVNSAGFTGLSGTGFNNITPDLTITTTGIQTILFTMDVRFNNTTGTGRNAGYRLYDVTANIYPFLSHVNEITAGGHQVSIFGALLYTVPAAGARTFRLQAGASAAGAVDVLNHAGLNSQGATGPTLQAVIL